MSLKLLIRTFSVCQKLPKRMSSLNFTSKQCYWRGRPKDGLYVFYQSQIDLINNQWQLFSLNSSYASMSTQPSVYNSSVVPTPSFSSCSVYALWHNRLGRPSKKVVRNVLQRLKNLIYINKIGSIFCSSCCLAPLKQILFQEKRGTCNLSKSTEAISETSKDFGE